ncbi:MAG: hypothetical protein R2828_27660 [Saprospiraceae bacterium]
MRNLILIFFMFLAGAIVQQLLPWWSIWVLGIVIGFFIKPGGALKAFSIGFVGAALLWGAYAFWLNWQNGGIMATRIGTLFGGLNPGSLLVITALFGGIFGGLGTLCGYVGQSLFQRDLSANRLK